MKNANKLNCRDKMFYMNIIAQKDKEICEIIAEKDETIDYYRRAAEMATRSKHRALERRDEQRRDIVAWGIFAVGMALSLWLAGAAIHTFLLWSNGR